MSTVSIRLPGGEIKALHRDSFIHARGIRYARAERFQKPEAVTSWSGAQDCTTPAPVSPQNPARLEAVIGEINRNRPQSEDCLHLSVLAPESAKGLPVMVYIHGGAYVTGGGDLDPMMPTDIAKRGVVAVNVTYRLGVFGYLPIPEMDVPANLGLLDQREALRWVQRNIEVFGGDPSKVTVYGQSAGGDSIHCLMVADGTEGLFQRAILQSSTEGRFTEDWTERNKAQVEHLLKTFEGRDVRTVPVPDLLKAQAELLAVGRKKLRAILPFGPNFGQDPLPPISENVKRFAAATDKVDVLIGHTTDEDTAFILTDSEMSVTYASDQFAIDGIVEAVKRETGKQLPTYTFAWYPKGSEVLRACHCIELSLLLGDYDSDWKGVQMLRGPDADQVVPSLGKEMKDLWVAFAKALDLKGQHFVFDANYRFKP